MTDLVRLSCLLLLDLGFKDSWTYIFNFLYIYFLIQYFTKRNNFMVSRIWTFMTLVLFIFVNLVFFCPKMILWIKIEISRNVFYNSLVFTFIIKIRFPKEVSIATLLFSHHHWWEYFTNVKYIARDIIENEISLVGMWQVHYLFECVDICGFLTGLMFYA